MTPEILDDAQKRWAYKKWCEGYTLDQIAEALDCCRKTVQRAINGKPKIRPILKYRPEKRRNTNAERL